MAIDPNYKPGRAHFEGISGSNKNYAPAKQNPNESPSSAPKTDFSPLNPLTLRQKQNDLKTIAQLNGLVCRLEAFGIGGNGLSPVEGFNAPHEWMKNAGFPQLPDIAWITREFDKTDKIMKADGKLVGTFIDFKATWEINRQDNTLTVVKMPEGYKERFGDPPVVSFPLDSVERYLRQAQPKP